MITFSLIMLAVWLTIFAIAAKAECSKRGLAYSAAAVSIAGIAISIIALAEGMQA